MVAQPSVSKISRFAKTIRITGCRGFRAYIVLEWKLHSQLMCEVSIDRNHERRPEC